MQADEAPFEREVIEGIKEEPKGINITIFRKKIAPLFT